MGKKISLLIFWLWLVIPADVFALLIVDQTGNLLVNGNFENGTTSWVTTASDEPAPGPSAFTAWSQWINTPPAVSTQQFTNLVIDGQYSGRIKGDLNNGIDQYDTRQAGTYTFSAWVYILAGSAHIGLAYAPIYDATNSISIAATSLNTWEYLVITFEAPNENGGPIIYCANNNSDFLVDGAWLNSGSVNLSPYALENGFQQPSSVPVPEPSTMVFLVISVITLGWAGMKFKGHIVG